MKINNEYILRGIILYSLLVKDKFIIYLINTKYL